MSARRFALFAALAFFLMFVAGNLIANSWFKSWRLDLTENHLYSLSEGTVRTLDGLTEPVELTLYYSRDGAATAPQVQAYGARVREMLQSFAARSHGQVRFVEVNVEPFSEEEDQAQEAGVEPVRLVEGGDPFYFGLVGANAIDDKRTIAFFDPQREAFVEYEITRLIYELENPDRTRVGLITSLPMDPAAAQQMQGGQPLFASEMGRLMDVTKLAPDFTDIPDVDVLAIIHPAPLTPAQAYAIDQFILRKGRAFIALDPASLMAQQSQQQSFDPFNPVPQQALTASNLDPLLPRWGVELSRDVVLDLENALPVQAQDENGQPTQMPQPLFFRVPAAQLDREDLMTAWLQRDINFGLAGGLNVSPRPGLEAHNLAWTTSQTMRIPAAMAMMRPSPQQLLQQWVPGARRETVAVRLTGTLESAFPNGPPEGAALLEGQQALTQSATPAQLVIVSDVDFLADDFYVGPQGAVADNASFALNAIDILGGSDALVSLRSRAPSTRRMELVERMEADAQRSIQRRQQELQTELDETEQQLSELQARGRGSGFFSGDLGAELTPEERGAIDRFRERVVSVRGELRGVERDLRRDIDNLKAAVVFVNVWLAPLLIAAGGLFLFWRRQRRAKGARR
jgi:ABC-2 type transport system permease protein